MRRSGTGFRDRSTPIWPCLLCLCGSACGDSVVVAREFSLVSAAVESRDAGSDADSFEPHFDFGHGGAGPVVPHTPPHFGPGGSSGVAPHPSKGDGDDSDGSGGGGGTGGKSGEPKHS